MRNCDWEQRKLGEVVDISSGGTPDRGKSSYWDGTIPWATTAEVNYSEITNTKEKITIEGLNNSSAKLMPIGTILLAMYGQGKTRGQLGILAIEAATNQANANIQVHRYIYNYFMYYQLVRKYKLLRGLSNEGGQANLSLGIVKNIHVTVINNLDEQIKIGTFFKKLDATIALHQRNVALLKRLKEAYLKRMLPQNSENKPLLRFADFSDPWEQRKLGEHALILTGGTPKTQIKEFWEPKEIPWMSSGEINKKRLFSTDNQISKLGFESSSARWVKVNSVLIALAGQGKTRGTVAINEIPLTTNQSIAAIEPDDSLYSEFLFQNLENRYEELRLESSGDGSRGGLNKQIISNVKIIAPSIQEQRKVGSFFKQLDDTIALHQSRLEKLTDLKQVLLAKMFL